ncbi:MAG: GspH/FimT family pseudopilin [Candidatus Kerfeldbacteria bacterium]|nr:GspH/FimT family pseudopilin [Candidatus Kerfeldbacteria bacterium]
MNKPGFSLLELMVVMAVLVLLSILVIPSFSGRQQSANLRDEARALLNDLRLAQQLTVAEQKTHLVKLYSNPLKYQILKRDGGDTLISEHNLVSGISWQNLGGFPNNEVTYNTTGAVTQAGNIILTNTNSQTATVEVKPSGYVKLQ